MHSHIPLIRNKSLSSHERFEQLVRNLVDWPRAIKHCQENGMTALHFAVLVRWYLEGGGGCEVVSGGRGWVVMCARVLIEP